MRKTYMVQNHHQSSRSLEILFNKKKFETLPKDLVAIVRYLIWRSRLT